MLFAKQQPHLQPIRRTSPFGRRRHLPNIHHNHIAPIFAFWGSSWGFFVISRQQTNIRAAHITSSLTFLLCRPICACPPPPHHIYMVLVYMLQHIMARPTAKIMNFIFMSCLHPNHAGGQTLDDGSTAYQKSTHDEQYGEAIFNPIICWPNRTETNAVEI